MQIHKHAKRHYECRFVLKWCYFGKMEGVGDGDEAQPLKAAKLQESKGILHCDSEWIIFNCAENMNDSMAEGSEMHLIGEFRVAM